MKTLRLPLLAAATVLLLALPAPASAARTKSCEGIGDTITKLRAKGISCDDAVTLAAKWAETAAEGNGASSIQIDGLRCTRRNPPGPGVAVRCAKNKEATLVSFRFRRP